MEQTWEEKKCGTCDNETKRMSCPCCRLVFTLDDNGFHRDAVGFSYYDAAEILQRVIVHRRCLPILAAMPISVLFPHVLVSPYVELCLPRMSSGGRR